jgi:hypothetical protein
VLAAHFALSAITARGLPLPDAYGMIEKIEIAAAFAAGRFS